MSLLDLQDVVIELPRSGSLTRVIDGVNLTVEEGEILGVCGESGSGKSVTMMSLLGLLPRHTRICGSAKFDGVDLYRLSPKELRKLAGRRIGMIFQDPMSTLHPMLSIGTQMTDHVRRHLGVDRREASRLAASLLDEVRIHDPYDALRSYPHQFSGGMRQRISLATALVCEPRLLVADEPTTALDVTVQASILRLLAKIREDRGIGIVLISHDLGVSSALADRLVVFYAGSIMESGPSSEVLQRPRHPYTAALLGALPRHSGPGEAPSSSMAAIPGSLPSPEGRPTGCVFHPRCSYTQAACTERRPELVEVDQRSFACPVDPFRG